MVSPRLDSAMVVLSTKNSVKPNTITVMQDSTVLQPDRSGVNLHIT
jgi:hypothetical protein